MKPKGYADLESNSSTATTVGETLARGAGWVTAAALAVGLANYAYALAMTVALSVEDFSTFAAGQALLLLVGTAAGASIPWVLASGIVTAGSDAAERQSVVWFAVIANVALGVVAGFVVALVATRFASASIAAILAISTVSIFSASTSIGWLQGHKRFKLIAGFRVVEVAVKATLGLTLVGLGARAGGALAGFAIGAAVLVLLGTLVMRVDVSPSMSAIRASHLWVRVVAMGSIQTLTALLASAGAVVVVLLPSLPSDAASYQVAALIGRIPVFLAGALAVVAFPLMSGADGERSAIVARGAVDAYLWVSVPFAVGMATIPPSILMAVFPSYPNVDRIVGMIAATGVLIGVVSLLATSHQAAGRFKATAQWLVLVVGLQAIGLAFGWMAAGVSGMAAGELAGVAVGTAFVVKWSNGELPRTLRIGPVQVVGWSTLTFALLVLRGHPAVWLTISAVVGVGVVYTGYRRTLEGDR